MKKILKILHPKTFIASSILLLICANILISPAYAEDAEEAATVISTAKNKLLSCYEAVREAETTGANITSVLISLNEAGSLLSRAELAFSQDDFDAALSFGVQSQNSLNGVLEAANVLKETGQQEQFMNSLIKVVASLLGVIVVLVAGFAVWRFLKKTYVASGANVK